MAEPQHASLISAPHPTPKPRPRPRYATPLQLPIDDTQDLRPPAPEAKPEPWEARQAVEEKPAIVRGRPSPPARTRMEWALLTVLVLGLGLNASVLLLDPALTRADVQLGGTVLLAGVVLLALLEICRRGGRPSTR
jgi:hypothetical protein